MSEMEIESRLVRLCIESASQSRDAIEKWRRQRRTLERMPSSLADALLHRLLQRCLLFPSLLEVFKNSVEIVDLSGESSVDAEWIAYLGAFRCLRSLNLADCHRLNSSALWPLTGMGSLREVDLSRCMKVNDTGISHLVSISTLEVLRISETGVSAVGVMSISSLTGLSLLDLGGLPVTDKALSSLQGLSKLVYLDLWGSQISNKGAAILPMFPKLNFVNLAWTSVTRLPNISSLESLNLSNCTIHSVLEGDGKKAPISKLTLSGATFVNEPEAILFINTSFLSYLNLSNSSFQGFDFLCNMKALEHLDVSSTSTGDSSLEAVVCIGANLKSLNLSRTRVTSAGVAVLVGRVPKVVDLSLSHTPIDDVAFSCIGMMPSLKFLDVSNTNIKGYFHQVNAEPNLVCSLTALHSLGRLEKLNLEYTQVRDAALEPLSCLQELRKLSLRNTFLSDISLHLLSSLSKLTDLGICDAVLTNSGLDLFNPPRTLKILDLRGCWLLTKDSILPFCKSHASIQVRHELCSLSSSDQHNFNHSSRSKTPSRHSRVDQKGKMLMTWPVSQQFAEVDQRLKYSREELLELQFQLLSRVSPGD